MTITKVHLCPRCKNRLDRVEYSDGSVCYQCHAPFDEPPYICDYEIWVLKNGKTMQRLD